MTTIAQLRKAALALPETEEGTHFGMVAFTVRGKGFASVTDDGIVQLQMSDDDSEKAVKAHAAAERLVRMGKPIGVRMPLDVINGKDLNALVERAWASRAPKRVVAAFREADSGQAPTGPDALPPGIGKPATSALLRAGIRSLSDVAAHTQADLLARHGVGPKAVGVLAEALSERGLSFREDGAGS